jgi:hypothetical protein
MAKISTYSPQKIPVTLFFHKKGKHIMYHKKEGKNTNFLGFSLRKLRKKVLVIKEQTIFSCFSYPSIMHNIPPVNILGKMNLNSTNITSYLSNTSILSMIGSRLSEYKLISILWFHFFLLHIYYIRYLSKTYVPVT